MSLRAVGLSPLPVRSAASLSPDHPGVCGGVRVRTHPHQKRVDAAGKLISSVHLLPRKQWAVLIPGHHPGYISWETYEANTARLRANWRPPPRARRRRAAGRHRATAGPAALRQVRADHADRVLRNERQQPPPRVCPRQAAVCHRARLLQHRRLEKTILAELFTVLEPASLEATAKGYGRGRRPVPAEPGRLRARPV